MLHRTADSYGELTRFFGRVSRAKQTSLTWRCTDVLLFFSFFFELFISQAPDIVLTLYFTSSSHKLWSVIILSAIWGNELWDTVASKVRVASAANHLRREFFCLFCFYLRSELSKNQLMIKWVIKCSSLSPRGDQNRASHAAENSSFHIPPFPVQLASTHPTYSPPLSPTNLLQTIKWYLSGTLKQVFWADLPDDVASVFLLHLQQSSSHTFNSLPHTPATVFLPHLQQSSSNTCNSLPLTHTKVFLPHLQQSSSHTCNSLSHTPAKVFLKHLQQSSSHTCNSLLPSLRETYRRWSLWKGHRNKTSVV